MGGYGANRVISALSGGSKRGATARSLKSLLYRATVVPQCPNYYRAIEAATTVTQGDRQSGFVEHGVDGLLEYTNAQTVTVRKRASTK
jgi:hypothetical protein